MFLNTHYASCDIGLLGVMVQYNVCLINIERCKMFVATCVVSHINNVSLMCV